MLFRKRASRAETAYDKPLEVPTGTPVIRASICTGEQVAGFRDEATGHFTEVMLLRNREDLQEFLRLYRLEESQVKKVY